MRKVSNAVVALLAAGVCGFITWVALDAELYTIIYNLAFLGIMLVIMLFAWVFGFRRINRTVRGLDLASQKLMEIYRNKGSIAEITVSGAKIFEVEYLDKKYQEYLAYLRKTNSPCDIGDYIGEYEINNYTHRKLVEMVPDILTSLGILGTFVGLVWGLKGFDPQTYEAMTSSVSSLVDGIKVAFITSIYGIALSMAFTYWLRGSLSRVSESLDNFLDKYYLCAVPPTDATAMNHLISNQKEQTRVMQDLADGMAEQMAVSFDNYVAPAMDHMDQTMDNFTQVVTMQQEQLLENIAKQVMDSMKKEILSEFTEMRSLLRESNRVQQEYLKIMSDAQSTFQKNFTEGEREMSRAMRASSSSQQETLASLQHQQEHLKEFVDYMAKVMEKMSQINATSVRTLEEVTEQLEDISPKKENADLEMVAERMNRMITLMEKQQRQQNKKGIFRK